MDWMEKSMHIYTQKYEHVAGCLTHLLARVKGGVHEGRVALLVAQRHVGALFFVVVM
jgi:hypothetical protein